MYLILWLVAAALIIWGIVKIARDRDFLWGAVLIVLGLLVGPGGVSIFDADDDVHNDGIDLVVHQF